MYIEFANNQNETREWYIGDQRINQTRKHVIVLWRKKDFIAGGGCTQWGGYPLGEVAATFLAGSGYVEEEFALKN